jgi:hypothetical protein
MGTRYREERHHGEKLRLRKIWEGICNLHNDEVIKRLSNELFVEIMMDKDLSSQDKLGIVKEFFGK